MKAEVGDRIVVRSHHVGVGDREGVIVAVEGLDGGPPFRVRWDDTGHEVLFFPGADTQVRPAPAGTGWADVEWSV